MNQEFMEKALQLAEEAEKLDEVPVGCVIVKDETVIATGYNLRETNQQALHHAEIIAIEQACYKLGTWRLEDCDLYVTLEPCLMCAGAITQARIKNVYFGAFDPKGGAYGSKTNFLDIEGLNHYPVVQGGILEQECSSVLTTYFQNKRKQNKKSIHDII